MAGQQVVTELVIDSDTSGADRFSQAMDSASASAQQGIGSANGAGLAIAGVGAAGLAAVLGINSLLDYVAKANKSLADMQTVAKQAGLSLADFQGIQFGGQVAGLSTDQINKGLQESAKLLNDASRNSNTLTKELEANGLSVKNANGQLITQNQLIGIAANLISNAKNPGDQLAIAQMLGFTKEWIPLLEQGAGAMSGLTAEAIKAGAVIDDETIKKAADFDAKWRKSSVEWSSYMKTAIAEMLPGVDDLIQRAVKFIDQVKSKGGGIEGVVKAGADAILNSAGIDPNQVHTLEVTPEAINSWNTFVEKITAAKEYLSELANDAGIKEFLRSGPANDNNPSTPLLRITSATPLPASQDPMQSSGYPKSGPADFNALQKAIDAADDAAGDLADSFSKVATRGADANDVVDRAINTLTRHIGQQKADALAIGLGDGALAAFRASAAETAAVLANGGKETDEQSKKFAQLKIDAFNAADALAKVKVASQIDFNLKTAFLSQEDISIANQLKGMFGTNVAGALGSAQAEAIRFTNAIKDMRDGGISFATDFAHGLESGKTILESLGVAAQNLGKKLIDAGLTRGINLGLDALTGASSGALGGVSGAAALTAGAATAGATLIASATTAAGILAGAGAVSAEALTAGAGASGAVLTLDGTAAAAALTESGAAAGGEIVASSLGGAAALTAGGTAAGAALWGPIAAIAAIGVGLGLTFLGGGNSSKKALQDAQTAWAAMTTQVVNFGLAAKNVQLGPLTQQLQSLFSTSKQLQDAAAKAHDFAGETSAANAFNNSVERIWAEFKTGTQTLDPLQQQIKSVNDEAAGLKDTLNELGFSGRAAQIDGIVQQQIDALTQQFNATFITGLTARLNTATGQTFLNDAANLLVQHQQDLTQAGELGNDPTLLAQVANTFHSEAQKIVDDAQLVGTAFTDFTTQFPMLQGVVHEFTASAVTDAKALQDAQNSAAKNVTDYLNGLVAGPGSTQSPTATLASAQTLYSANLGVIQTSTDPQAKIDAQNKFVSLADNLEKAARVVYASGQGYQDIRNQIINQGLNLPAVQGTTDPVTQAVRDAIIAIQIGNAAIAAANTAISAAASGTTGAVNAANSNIVGAVGGTTGAVNSSNSVGTLTGIILPAVNAGNAESVAAYLAGYFGNLNRVQAATTDAVYSGTGQLVPSVNSGNAAAVASALTGLFNQIDPTGRLASVVTNTGVLGTISTNTGNLTGIVTNTGTTATNAGSTATAISGANGTNAILTLLNSALNPTLVDVPVTDNRLRAGTGGSGQPAAVYDPVLVHLQNQVVTALNKIVFNTYAIASNTNVGRTTDSNKLGVLASGGWITGGIPGRDSVPLASGNALGMPGEFVVRHDIAQMNKSWLPDFNATGRLPFNDNSVRSNFTVPNVVQFRGGGNADLIAEVRALRQEVAQLRSENNSGNAAIANTTSQGLRAHAEKLGGKIEESGKRGAFAVTQAAQEKKAS